MYRYAQRRPQFRPRFQGHRAAPTGLNPTRYIQKAVVKSEEIYQSQHQFEDFAISELLKKNIRTRGYQTPTPIQDQAIPLVLAGNDVVGIANTGTGKTAAFLIPLIQKIMENRLERVLVIVPTRELGVQIEEDLRSLARGLPVTSAVCIGGTSISQQISAIRRQPYILIGTPGRLKDLIQRRVLQLANFKTIVLDEVDRMVDIGFIQDIKYLLSFLPQPRQSLFFSATVSAEIRGIIDTFLRNPITVSVKKQETPQTVEQNIIKVRSKEEKVVKLSELLRQDEYTKVLVFVRTKWNADKLAKHLYQNGFSVAAIHGNKSQNQRLRALAQFKQNQIQVMVATDIAARGLDIERVSHVVNFDEPDTYDNYVHRIGRTGRADRQGKALTFVM